ELFGIDVKAASDLAFTLSDAQLAAYDPGKFFTSTELIDTVPQLDQVPTEDDLKVITDGIPASLLVGLSTYPSGNFASAATAAAGANASAAGTAFVPAPGP